MYITLIRDNVPANTEKAGTPISYAKIQNDELFIDLLREKLVEAVNAFLQTGSFEALAETHLIVDTFASLKPEYKDIYDKQLEELGYYNERYLYVQLTDPQVIESSPSNEDISESDVVANAEK